MPISRLNDDGLSEIIGFVLILGLIVVASTMYLLYVVPAEGREDEIVHMNVIKDRFVDYKGTLDSLWMNSISNLTDHRLTGTTISTSFDLGTGGGNTQTGGVFLSFMKPQGGPALMTVGQSNLDGTLTIIADKGDPNKPIFNRSIPMGALAYQSQNNYWIQQTYYYQMGGVFLNQTDGASVVAAPAISVYNVTVPGDGITYTMPKVCIAGLRILGRGSIGGTGPLRIDTRLTENIADTTNEQYTNVTVKAVMNTSTAAQLWDKVFRNAGRQMSLQYNNISFTSPGGTFNNTPINSTTAIMNVKAGWNVSDVSDTSHVYLDLTQAEYRVALQNVGQ